MSTTMKQAGKASSVPGGMMFAASVGMITTLALSAAIASLLNSEKITWEQAGYWIMGMLFAASFISGKCAYAAIKRQRITVSLMSGVLYWGLLLCLTALFWGGNFGSVWETAGIIIAGSGTAGLITMPNHKKYRKKTGRGYC